MQTYATDSSASWECSTVQGDPLCESVRKAQQHTEHQHRTDQRQRQNAVMTTGQCTMNALLVAQSICRLLADGPDACGCSLSMRYRDVAAQETTQKTSRATTVHHSCCWPVMGRKNTPLSPDTTVNIMFTVVSPSANTAEKNAHVAPQMVAQWSHNGRTMVAQWSRHKWSHNGRTMTKLRHKHAPQTTPNPTNPAFVFV